MTPSPRQQQIAALLAEGLTAKGVGRRLGIATRTVCVQVQRAGRRLAGEGSARQRLVRWLTISQAGREQMPRMTTEEVARVCHEVNRAYCLSLGDHTQLAWEDAPGWQRDSAVNGVRFHLDHPDAGPDHSHVQWHAQKGAAGWTWGPTKDPEKKEHPCMVPYDELPVEQKAKDFLFRGVVHALGPLTL